VSEGKELSGRVALVTGAGRNIGRSIALSLAAGGAAVVVNARSNEAEANAVVQEVESAGGKALAALAEVSDEAQVRRMVEAAVARFGRLDVLVNNVAMRRETPIEKVTLDEWHAVLRVILDGAFICTQACLPHLKASGSGAIINLGGLSAHSGSKDRAHVMTAKMGIVGLTHALAHDLADSRVTVNCVAPGLIATQRHVNAPEPQHRQLHQALLGERGKPEDIAAMVRLLAGPGGRFVTGQTIHVNGGAYLG
jgi:3-oxoacyl-[acyl-carrier protein] reductase